MSQEGEWFLAGILDGIADGLFFPIHSNPRPKLNTHSTQTSNANGKSPSPSPISPSEPTQLVPTINGYKRLVGGEAFWAPNAVTYGYDSRAASIRIISPPSVPPSATRLEIRVPGADMNPYFALSAIFLLGLRGIEKKLALPCKPIALLTAEDRALGKVKMLPTSLEAATQRMIRPDSIARELGMFGNDFVDHYGGTREHEVRLWNQAVTNWEVERYLELA
ncbi:hypothetical protein C0995_016415 [Termitomyces sp. Mi166|nr:hypothetical protein C0995_016415 [Termitomyces sp. Mi166\